MSPFEHTPIEQTSLGRYSETETTGTPKIHPLTNTHDLQQTFDRVQRLKTAEALGHVTIKDARPGQCCVTITWEWPEHAAVHNCTLETVGRGQTIDEALEAVIQQTKLCQDTLAGVTHD